MSTPGVWGPVLLAAADSLAAFGIDPAGQDDVETYWDVEFAAARQYSEPDFHERSDARLEPHARALDARLGVGWLAGAAVGSPQSVHTFSTELREITATNPATEWAGDKPAGAFWTASVLPDGDSAWTRREGSEFSTQSRPRRYLHFRLGRDETIFTIRGVADYHHLVTTYPRRAPSGLVGVDWGAVGRDHVAVPLAACGLARAQHYRFTTPHGPAVLLGWDAESMAWLRWPSFVNLSTGPA